MDLQEQRLSFLRMAYELGGKTDGIIAAANAMMSFVLTGTTGTAEPAAAPAEAAPGTRETATDEAPAAEAVDADPAPAAEAPAATEAAAEEAVAAPEVPVAEAAAVASNGAVPEHATT